jgi:predicted lipid-binding transport protein (Tim44 family)
MKRSPVDDYLKAAESSGVAPHRRTPAEQFAQDAAAAARKAQRKEFRNQVLIGLIVGLIVGGAMSAMTYWATHGGAPWH